MTWTKLGDEFTPTAAELSDAAFRTHVEALGWSCWRLLDLRIPKQDVRRFANTPDPDAAIAELVDRGWWEDRGDNWWIGCRWPEWQQSREQVEEKRAKWAADKERQRRHRGGDHSMCTTRSCRYLSTVESTSGLSTDLAATRPESTGGPGVGVGVGVGKEPQPEKNLSEHEKPS